MEIVASGMDIQENHSFGGEDDPYDGSPKVMACCDPDIDTDYSGLGPDYIDACLWDLVVQVCYSASTRIREAGKGTIAEAQANSLANYVAANTADCVQHLFEEPLEDSSYIDDAVWKVPNNIAWSLIADPEVRIRNGQVFDIVTPDPTLMCDSAADNDDEVFEDPNGDGPGTETWTLAVGTIQIVGEIIGEEYSGVFTLSGGTGCSPRGCSTLTRRTNADGSVILQDITLHSSSGFQLAGPSGGESFEMFSARLIGEYSLTQRRGSYILAAGESLWSVWGKRTETGEMVRLFATNASNVRVEGGTPPQVNPFALRYLSPTGEEWLAETSSLRFQ